MEEGRMHGRLDAPLNPNGIEEASRRSQALLGQHYDCFYSSPTGRAMQTAGIIGCTIHMQAVPLEDLVELDFGGLEGLSKEHVAGRIGSKKQMLRGWVKPFGENGETLFQLFLRCKKVLRDLLKNHHGQSILIVSHGIFINMAVRILTGKYLMYFDLQPVGIVKMEINRFGLGRILSIDNGK
jgi:broad specificity phosphatase PhoE